MRMNACTCLHTRLYTSTWHPESRALPRSGWTMNARLMTMPWICSDSSDLCTDMRVDMCMDMRIDVRVEIRIGMHLDMCIDM